ncbi:MAG: hypothetical protein ACKVJK_10780, partial [Methylophagaceae bacterium]
MATNKDFIIKNGLVVGGDITGVTDLYVDDQIISTGDTNTYLQFHSADQFRVVTGGVERLEVNGNGIGVVGDIKIGTTTVIDASRNLTNIGGISATGTSIYSFIFTGTQSTLIHKIGSATQTSYASTMWETNDGLGQIWKTGSAYTAWGGADALNIY